MQTFNYLKEDLGDQCAATRAQTGHYTESWKGPCDRANIDNTIKTNSVIDVATAKVNENIEVRKVERTTPGSFRRGEHGVHRDG